MHTALKAAWIQAQDQDTRTEVVLWDRLDGTFDVTSENENLEMEHRAQGVNMLEARFAYANEVLRLSGAD